MTLFLVGGYTADSGGTAEGIGLLRTDGSSVEFLGTIAPAASPSWVLVDGARVYAVGEADATVASWRRVGGSLEWESTVAAGGGAPCHLALDGDALLVSCYGGGVLTRVPLASDGRPSGDGIPILRGAGGGPHPDQDVGRIHASVVRPDDSVVALDLGSDTVHLLDPDRRPEVAIALPAGTGPRDIRLLPDGRMLVLGELNGTLVVLSSEGDLLGIGRLPGVEPRDHAAALALAPIGDVWRVVTGLRGSDRVSVVDVMPDGSVVSAASAPSGGAWPRNLVLDGDYVRVANERSSGVASLELRDDETLAMSGSTAVPSPTHLVPVPDEWGALAR